MNQYEEQELLKAVDKILDRYPVPTKYADLQSANERRVAKQFSVAAAVVIAIGALAWFLWK